MAAEYRVLIAKAREHDHNRNGGRPPGVKNFPRAVAAKRHHEKKLRGIRAGNRARSALAVAYPGVYRRLYEEALKEVNRERGPLPGDETRK